MIQYIVVDKSLKEFPNELLSSLVQTYIDGFDKVLSTAERDNFEKWYSDEQKKIVLQADSKNFNKLMAQNEFNFAVAESEHGKVMTFHPYPKNEIESLMKRLQVFKSNDYLVESNESSEYEFLINENLSMSLGKLAAQVGHVCVEISRSTMELSKFKNATFRLLPESSLLEKVELGFPYIRDNGHTEIEKDSLTVVANKRDPS